MTNLKDKNILITGSQGFIGKHLTNHLTKNGLYKRLTLLDINETSSGGEVVRTISGSFVDETVSTEALRDQDIVFHLAAMVGVDNCLNNKEKLKEVNLDSTKRFIDLAVTAGCKKIVFSSSSEIYGNSPKVPYEETDVPTPVSDYAKYKLAIEHYLLEKVGAHSLNASIVRFFNVYGPGQRPEFVIAKFADLAKEGKDITVNGNGSQTRSFTFIDDAIRGLVLAAQYDKTKYEIFNVGNNKETTILTLAEEVISLFTDKSLRIVQIANSSLNRYDSDRRLPSITKAETLLGFKPTVDVKEGLSIMLSRNGKVQV